MEKIFNQKNFNNFVWSSLGSRGNIYINYCLQAHFQVSAAWYCSHYLPPVANIPPVSLIPVAICHRRPWHQRQICRWYRYTGGNFATGVNNTRATGGKFCCRCRWYLRQICCRCRWYRRQFATIVIDSGGAPWLANISGNFRKKIEMILRLLSGALGKVIHEKNLKQKNLVTLSL